MSAHESCLFDTHGKIRLIFFVFFSVKIQLLSRAGHTCYILLTDKQTLVEPHISTCTQIQPSFITTPVKTQAFFKFQVETLKLFLLHFFGHIFALKMV